MKIQASTYDITFGNAAQLINEFVAKNEYKKVFILTDDNTMEACLRKIHGQLNFTYCSFSVLAGERFKTTKTARQIWRQMVFGELDRHSLMINLGGGVIGDMGGFCASTYMRGIDFVQVPTTLLSQVDASVGGKLAIDLMKYKNIVGLFNNPKAVIIDTSLLTTLPGREIISGFAEMLKHGLIQDAAMWTKLVHLPISAATQWESWVKASVEIKNKVVSIDPKEKGLRKILNFGHTVGHAIESVLLHTDNRLLHGEAIAIGMICESRISMRMGLLSKEECKLIKKQLLKIYPTLPLFLPPYDLLINYMKKDKKNRNGEIHFCLLNKIGEAVEDVVVEEPFIIESMDFYSLRSI